MSHKNARPLGLSVRAPGPVDRRVPGAASAVLLTLALGLVSRPALASPSPTAGTFSAPTSTTPGVKSTLTFTGDLSLPLGTTETVTTCLQGTEVPGGCDVYKLTVDVPPSFYATTPAQIEVLLTWTSAPFPAENQDLDIYVTKPDGTIVAASTSTNLAAAGGTGEAREATVIYNLAQGSYHVVVVDSVSTAASSYQATLSFVVREPPPPVPTTTNIFAIHTPPAGVGEEAGEPLIGVNHATGNVMYQAGLQTLRVTFDDTSTPPTATWKDVSSPLTSLVTLDPFIFTDRVTNRTFVSQLQTGCSVQAYTDDDGETWVEDPIGCGIASGADHQSIASGRYAPGGPSGGDYPHAVYYCSQSIAAGHCALSTDGGDTYGPGVVAYTLLQCGGLHGQVQIAPDDGTVYLPNKNCGGEQGVVVSTNNGASWTVRTVPDSGTSESDPAVFVGADGTVYFAYEKLGRVHAAVSRDKGVTWTDVQALGAEYGIANAVFPKVTAGDGDRAAITFLGSTTPGDPQAEGFGGIWNLYVAVTYDGGVTWSTYNATADDPVQRGCIWLQGGSNPCRNLLDFIGITMDQRGRVLVSFADGCVDGCVTDPSKNTLAARASIARQFMGKGLLAAFDLAEVFPPGAPVLSGTPGDRRATLSWTEPSNGGAAIGGYKVFRHGDDGSMMQVASLGPVTTYEDTGLDNGVAYRYTVVAANSAGSGPASNEVVVVPMPPAVDGGMGDGGPSLDGGGGGCGCGIGGAPRDGTAAALALLAGALVALVRRRR